MSQIVLVTGVATGMGAATVERLTRAGYLVEGCDVIPGDGYATVDVRDTEAVDTWVKAVTARHGRIDAVVTFAASGLVGSIEETHPVEAAALFDTNVVGTHRVVRAALPAMRSRGSGRVVVVSSGAAAVAEPYGGWYSVTKAAIERLGESLRLELAQFGVSVSILAPGWTVTPIIESSPRVGDPIPAYDRDRTAVLDRVRGYLARGQRASDVADKVLAILASARPRRIYLCGRDVRTSFWTRRLLPDRLYQRLVRDYYGV